MNKILERRSVATQKLCGSWTTTTETVEEVIPAIAGEFYAYSARFTPDKPVYPLLKCKSNKFWTLGSLNRLGAEANLLFSFGLSPEVRAIESADGGASTNTWVAPVNISAGYFYQLHSLENVQMLVDLCNKVCIGHDTKVGLSSGLVVAMMTDTGKYGMFVVRRLTPESVHIDACHILL